MSSLLLIYCEVTGLARFELLDMLGFRMHKELFLYFRHTLNLKKAMTSPRVRSDSTCSGKAKMTKMLVECRREGIVRQLADGADAAQPRWDKCRLVLVRTTGGDLLEFYIPPKVVVSHSLFCWCLCSVILSSYCMECLCVMYCCAVIMTICSSVHHIGKTKLNGAIRVRLVVSALDSTPGPGDLGLNLNPAA
jgi:hypothetical protein